jgi:predicted phage terminase large subunit-like protein
VLPPTRKAAIAYYRRVHRGIAAHLLHAAQRELARSDLFYLITVVLARKDLDNDWLFARCREVQSQPNGYLDLWAREHYKSTIITFGLTIFDILNDPEITVGIFSFNRPMARAFLRQIKQEFEANEKLRSLFPDIIWENPHRDSPKWSEDDGIIVRRKSNPKEGTVEAWGLVDSQPTSKHFRLMVYDDVVHKDSVTTSDMIKKTTEAWEVSLALGANGGERRMIGTRWHYNDTYRLILERGAAIERRYPITEDGTVEGEPVLLSRELVMQKRRDMGPYSFGSQMLLDPVADRAQGFREDWLRYYEPPRGGDRDFANMNKYLLVDAASAKKKDSDYTSMVVIGLAEDENYYLLDMVRDRLSLTERGAALFALHRRWHPRRVGYERYGQMADIEYMKDRMREENYRFEIVEVGGQVAKLDRIRRMIPVFEAGRFMLPEMMLKVDYEGRHVDLVTSFVNDEYKPFPVGLHDDMLDSISRIWDIDTIWPKPPPENNRYAKPRARSRERSWMSA